MKNKIVSSLCFLLVGCSSIQAVSKHTSSFQSSRVSEGKLIVQNRILAKVNGKSISTYDVVKKMDISFYREFPEYVSSLAARYQFYMANWESALEDLINKELVLADAQEKKVEISSGEVRKEMEQMFGPNMIENLDKAGLSFDEAAKIVQGDLLLQRMLGIRVYSRVVRMVTPSKVRQAYETFLQDPKNAKQTQWRYQVITFQDRTSKRAEELANKAYQLLMNGVSFSDLTAKLKEQKLMGRKAKVSISDEIHNKENELSESYKQALSPMETGMYSQPVAQKSRKTNTTVYRIFYVKEKVPGGFPPFKEMETPLKNQLLDQISSQEIDSYIKKLRQYYYVRNSDLKAMIPSDYQPFVLQQ
jgi:hypothetical protein